jgi:hypothetical protein
MNNTAVTMTANTCSCGESAPHVIANRATADGISVQIWHDGCVTGRFGRALPGVPCVRPRTPEAVERERAAARLLCDDLSLYDLAELPRLYAACRRVAARGGDRKALYAVLAEGTKPSIPFSWVAYATDRDGKPTVRVARLDRIRWPGLVVWHERGRYELMALRRGTALGARSHEALEATGFSFGSQRELCAHLFAVAHVTV